MRKNPIECCLNTLGTTLLSWKPYPMLTEWLQTTLQKTTLQNFALILFTQHCTGESPMQSCSKGSRQHGIWKNSVHFCLNTLRKTLHGSKPYPMESERHEATLYQKKSCVILSWYCWDNIAQLETICNVASGAPDFAQEKILCSVSLILLGQHCIGQTLCNVVWVALDNIT